MNCKACNYPLWNLPDRRCPECGQDFFPSQFEFVPRAVRFLCPFCKQQYFGTDEHGHLVPRTFNCVNCSNRINMDEMVLLPAEGVEASLTAQEINPWLNTQNRGFFNRWLATIGRSMTAPTRLIASTPPDSSGARAFTFALINVLLSFVLNMGLMAVIFLFSPGGTGAASLGFFGAMIALGAGVPIVWTLLWTVATHGILRIGGPLKGGLRTTSRCMWYASGPAVIAAVPCIGSYVLSLPALIWCGVSATIMLAKSHAIGGVRATVATFLPVLLAVGCIVGLIIFPIFMGVSTAMTFARNSAMSAQSVLQQSRVTTMSMALLNYRNVNNIYPTHALELIGGSAAQGMDFSLTTDPLAIDAIPVGNTTLGAFETATPSSQQQTVSQLLGAMPKDVVAHRVGDYVFTYHQLPVSGADPGLWVFIAECTTNFGTTTGPAPTATAQGGVQAPASAPAPSGAPGPTAAPVVVGSSPAGVQTSVPMYHVGLTNGSSTSFPKSMMPTMLQQQNTLRAQFNIPPLPDPSTVTASKPAVPPK